VAAILAAILVGVVACQEKVPTALDDSRLPGEPLTVEIDLAWSDFGSNFQVLGGYGSAASLALPVVAHTYEGTLESRLLVRFGAYPPSAQVVNSDGATVVDTDVRHVAGRLVVMFDTVASTNTGLVELQLSALQEEWEVQSTSWAFAVDSVADQRAWSVPGAGPTIPMSTTVWDPATSDSVSFQLDSADVALWMDPTDPTRGGRIETTTDGVRLRLTRALLRITMRPSLDPDTLVEDTATALIEKTFIYDPPPTTPTGIRVGGTPSWRTVMNLAIPPLTGPPELCAAVGCPFTPEAGHISYAALALTSQATELAFQPTDTVRLDVRPVLSPAALPKSPLGTSATGDFGVPIAPEAFGASAGTDVEVPVTPFIRDLLGGPDPEGRPPPSMLALMSAAEPASLSFASFFGPADPAAPVLKLILTVGNPQVLP
jgi:hypothetical protein